ncbi:MAG TPA: HAD-IB family phosphatase [Solirubrobacteraceae bacterium]|jgi:phosphoserine phosphatase|nr:HAD-IB family phosphatase [Solirubrobacteraceae bacterium]
MRAHIFDMDGTLVRSTSAPVLVAAAMGRGDSLVELEERFAAGVATAADFARALHEMWGVVPPEVARRAFVTAPLLENVREVLHDIRLRGEVACVITMSPDYFAEHFLEFGFDAVFASRFPRSADVALDEEAILNPEDKPLLAARFCAEHGVQLRDAVAYGDSMSDVFLFGEVGLRVSVNGDHHLAELADIAVEGSDLMLAYRAAREWCDGVGSVAEGGARGSAFRPGSGECQA